VSALSPPGPVETTLDVLGGFKVLIVWRLFWGARPFCDLLRQRAGMSKRALRHALAEMERQGVVRREAPPGGDPKPAWALTPRGETLKPIVAAMYEWGLHHPAATAPRPPASRPAPPPRPRSAGPDGSSTRCRP
jgi:DNA-binding HxlR family transcriptional regulator